MPPEGEARTALALTATLTASSAALLLARETENLRLTFLFLLACGGVWLALPRLWRWLFLVGASGWPALVRCWP